MINTIDISLNFNVDELLQQFIYNIDTPTEVNNTLNYDDYIETISDEGLNQLKHKHYFKYLYKNQKNCSISMENFKENEEIVELPCEHIFKSYPILKWVKTNPTCPICRYKLKTEFKIKNYNNEINHPYFLDNSNNFISEMQDYEIQYEVDILHETLLNAFRMH